MLYTMTDDFVRRARDKHGDKQTERTATFKKRAKEVHGDRYEYDRAECTGRHKKVTITCRMHGDFEQIAGNHLNGSGCPKCAGKSCWRPTPAEFVAEAARVHTDKGYDLSRTVYAGSARKVTVGCPVHGFFDIIATLFVNGAGCQRCSMPNRGMQTPEFVARCKGIHGAERFDYSDVGAIKSVATDFVSIKCNKCDKTFTQRAYSHLRGLNGCPTCSITKPHTTESFIEAARKCHGDKYMYDDCEYTTSASPVTITCSAHGQYIQAPSSHLAGRGCPVCGLISRALQKTKSTEEFVASAKLKHGDKYDYNDAVYSKCDEPVAIRCKKHGVFEQTAGSHLAGRGCPACAHAGFSQMAIEWIEYMSRKRGIPFRHALNGGEVKLDGIGKIDGFNEEHREGLEFHGSMWHGDPTLYSHDDINPVNGVPMNVLYEETMARDQRYRDAGITLHVMWESEWLTLRKKVLCSQ